MISVSHSYFMNQICYIFIKQVGQWGSRLPPSHIYLKINVDSCPRQDEAKNYELGADAGREELTTNHEPRFTANSSLLHYFHSFTEVSMAIRFDKFTVKAQQAIQQAQTRAAE